MLQQIIKKNLMKSSINEDKKNSPHSKASALETGQAKEHCEPHSKSTKLNTGNK